jgi:glycosyltransferase involved in cell wall biosynthesis
MEKIFNKLNSIRSAATLKRSIKKGLARIDSSDSQPRIIGYKQYLDKSASKKALVSYLVQPVIEALSGIDTALFSNSGAGRTIPKVLNEMGYEVDVINWDDTSPVEGEYDLVIYHGGKNFNQIKKLKTSKNKLVYYSTGSYWQFHNKEEKKRLEYFVKRHGQRLGLDREIKYSEEEANIKADAIIVLGNANTAKTYSKFKNVYNIEGASMPIAKPRLISKPLGDKLGFLFLSGPGNLHKGLDIVLDAWQKLPTNYELHIITYLEDDFTKFYHKELYATSNIHTYGYVPQRSKEFYKIINQCQYSILLSCSEGSPGSVIESMCQGLIPIISKASHISVPEEGIVVDPVDVDNFVRIISSIKIKSDKIVAVQEQVRKWAEEKFTINRYISDFREIIGKITK